jgi:tRNA U55 pseudouridine synthase TruB
LQVPPNYSALKIKGERAYDLARCGVDFELKPRPVTVSTKKKKKKRKSKRKNKKISLLARMPAHHALIA